MTVSTWLCDIIYDIVIFLYKTSICHYNSIKAISLKDNNALGTQKTVSFDFDKGLAREGRQGNLKNSQTIFVYK